MRKAVLGLLAVLGALAPPGARAASAFGPGEQAVYQVRWMGMPAGEAQVTVGATMQFEGTDVWPIVCHARTTAVAAAFPIKDRFISYWDYGRSRSAGSDFLVDELGKRRRERVRLPADDPRAFVTRQKEGQPLRDSEWDVEPGSMDVAAAAMALRSASLQVGAVVEVPVFTGDRRMRMRATVDGREVLETALGRAEVFRVRVSSNFNGNLAAKRDLLVYLTADARKLPVRVEADFVLGTVTADLVRFAEGQAR